MKNKSVSIERQTLSGKPKINFKCKLCGFTLKTSGIPLSCPKCGFAPVKEIERENIESMEED